MSVVTGVLNGIVPMVFLVGVGVYLAKKKIIPANSYQMLISLTFNIFFPIATIYSLGRKTFTLDDVKIIVANYVAQFVIGALSYVMVIVYYKKRRSMAFGHVTACTLIQNIIITGMQITSGFYDSEKVEKYAYVIAFSQFTGCIPFILYQFEYAALREASTEHIRCAQIFKLVKKSLWNTIKNPMILGIFGALIYNAVKTLWVPQMAELPSYLAKFFTVQSNLVSSLGVVSIGVFTVNELSKKKDVAQRKLPQYLKLISMLIIRHFIFPLTIFLIMKLMDINKDIIELNVALSSSNSGLQAFALSDAQNLDGANAGMMILIGMPVEVLGIIILQQFVRMF